MANLSKEEVMQVLWRQSSCISRNNSRYQGVALQKIGGWGSELKWSSYMETYCSRNWNFRETSYMNWKIQLHPNIFGGPPFDEYWKKKKLQ